MVDFNESTIGQAALAWLEVLGYTILFGPEIASEEPTPEREDDIDGERTDQQMLGS